MNVESIRIIGKIKAVSEPFDNDKMIQPLITVETEKGFYSLPVSDIHKYAINQKVKISLTISEIETS
jgi:hypothetical protein